MPSLSKRARSEATTHTGANDGNIPYSALILFT
jgi:hypothetical protein